MMELFLNEKSLTGQFASVEEFSEQGVTELIAVLKEQKKLPVETILYKSVNMADAKVTSQEKYSDVIYGKSSRIHDGIRRYKTALVSLVDEPYWDSDSKQDPNVQYMSAEGWSMNGTSVAEAEARNGVLVSFKHQAYSNSVFKMKKTPKGLPSTEVEVSNVWKSGQLTDVGYKRNEMSFKDFLGLKLENQKIDFSKSSQGKVWDNIPKEDESIVYDTFKTFCSLDWVQIPRSQGLGYKSYHKTGQAKRFFTKEEWDKGIMEFRITGKYRCFGNAEGGKFYLLLVDIEHLLGNL